MASKRTVPDPNDNLASIDAYPADVTRPRTRGECTDVPRPCPWVSCRYNLFLDVNPTTHEVKLNFDGEPDEMHPEFSCALDIAERGPLTLEDVADATRLTRERVRQLEHRAMKKLKLLGNLMVTEPERRSEED